jgi:hypothetical protein
MGKQRYRYQVRGTHHGLYSVIDAVTGLPADVGATSVQLTKPEAEQLVLWLQVEATNVIREKAAHACH